METGTGPLDLEKIKKNVVNQYQYSLLESQDYKLHLIEITLHYWSQFISTDHSFIQFHFGKLSV